MKNQRKIFLWLAGVWLLQRMILLPFAVEASDPEVWGTSSSVGSSSSLDDDDDDHEPPQRRPENGSHPDRVGGPQEQEQDLGASAARVVEAVVVVVEDLTEDDSNNPQAAAQQQQRDEEEKVWGSTAASAAAAAAARRTETSSTATTTTTATGDSPAEPSSAEEPDPTTQGMEQDANDLLAAESAGIPKQMKPDNVLLVFSNSTTPSSNKGTAAGENSNSKQRLWGSGSGAHESSNVDPQHPHPQQHDKDNNNNDDDDNVKETTTSGTIHIPYVPGRHSNRTHDPDGRPAGTSARIHPPDGFTLRARVYIDPQDQRAHFDATPVTLPYYDCGAAGSTTAPLHLAEMYIRHSLSAPTSAYPFSEETLHPVLAVVLQAATLHLSSGDILELHPGDVVLLEDGLKPGHVLRPLHGSARQRSVTVLFLQLPQQHRHIGKEHLSIPTTTTASRRRRAPGCPTEAPVAFSGAKSENGATSSWASATTTTTSHSMSEPILRRPTSPSLLTHHPRLRRFGLGLVALSVSTLAADFLGRVAPLWLAVGIGGTCFVVGTTYGITVGLETAMAALELRHERRRLRPQPPQRPPESSSDDASPITTTTTATSSTARNQDTAALLEPDAPPL